jgi:hypothetical protein
VAQAASRQPVTQEVWFQSQAIPCGIYGGQSEAGTSYSPSTTVFPVSHRYDIILSIDIVVK